MWRIHEALIGLLSAAFVIVLAAPAVAGSFAGTLQDPMGVGHYELAVNCNDGGNSTWGGAYWTPTTGAFSFYGTPGTVHSVVADDHLGWGPTYGLGLADNVYTHKVLVRANFFQYAPTWDVSWHKGVAQTFIASGTCVLKVTVRIASGTADHYVSVLRGGPNGPQVGPSKTVNTGGGGAETAVWQPGEVQTTRGEMYCVKVVRADGQACSLYLVNPLVDNGDACPEGCLWWFDGTNWAPDWNWDTGMIIISDGDGLLCNLNTGKWGKWGTKMVSATSHGQTFVARGTGLVSASFTVDTSANYTVSLYDYSDGSIGSQVGTSKTLAGAAYLVSNGVVWSPGEYPPLTPGNTYYIEIKRQYGGTFCAYGTNGSTYTGGVLFVNRVAQPSYDMASTIYAESAAGEAARPLVKIGSGSPKMSAQSSSSVTLYWTTDVGADTKVEYAVGRPPYTATYYSSALSTTHTAVLTGLSPNSLYHYRVSSARSGYRTAVSRDLVAATVQSGTNLLTNPGFETAALAPWASWSGDVQVHYGEWFANMPVRSGTYAAQFGQNWGTYSATGIYQRVGVTPGKWYRATGRFDLFPTDRVNNQDYRKYDVFGDSFDRLMQARMGLDPAGGTSGIAGSIVWSRNAYPFPNPNTFQGNQATSFHYICLSALAKATGATMTVFTAADAGSALSWDLWSVDDLAMSEVPTGRAGAAKASGNSTQVAISDAVVTATSTQVGAYYVENLDRSCGIRVESTDAANIGDVVTVFGGIATNANGERAVKNATMPSVTPGTALRPLGMTCKTVGGADLLYDGTTGQQGVEDGYGPNNIGELVCVWGRVSAVETEPGIFSWFINDGSLRCHGLKIDLAGLTPPEDGSYAAVTGISTCEKPELTLTRLLKPRSQSDIVGL